MLTFLNTVRAILILGITFNVTNVNSNIVCQESSIKPLDATQRGACEPIVEISFVNGAPYIWIRSGKSYIKNVPIKYSNSVEHTKNQVFSENEYVQILETENSQTSAHLEANNNLKKKKEEHNTDTSLSTEHNSQEHKMYHLKEDGYSVRRNLSNQEEFVKKDVEETKISHNTIPESNKKSVSEDVFKLSQETFLNVAKNLFGSKTSDADIDTKKQVAVDVSLNNSPKSIQGVKIAVADFDGIGNGKQEDASTKLKKTKLQPYSQGPVKNQDAPQMKDQMEGLYSRVTDMGKVLHFLLRKNLA